MSKLTADEVEALLLEHKEDPTDEYEDPFYWHDWQDAIPWREKELIVEVVGLGEVKVWDHKFDVSTNEAWMFFQIGNRIFRKEGRYYSHDGMYWDGDFSEVKPVQKIVTDYEVI